MIEGFGIGDRARTANMNWHASNPIEHVNSHVPSRRSSRRMNRLFARVVCRIGVTMVKVGHRLECYEARFLGETEGFRPVEAQIK